MAGIRGRHRLAFWLILWLCGLGIGLTVRLFLQPRRTTLVGDKEVVLVEGGESSPFVDLGIIVCGLFSIYYGTKWNEMERKKLPCECETAGPSKHD